MASIPKIVSTPVKWVSKQLLHRTLLRFPGGDATDPVACAFCPELCRFACPPAVTSGNDVVTPSNKSSALYQESHWPGRLTQGAELWSIYDCTGCGRCTEYCVHGVPVADNLFQAREKFAWGRAQECAAQLTDEQDPYGDLADELGDSERARARLARHLQHAKVVELSEPRQVFFLGEKGVSATLSFQAELLAEPGALAWEKIRKKLGAKRWLLAESSWMNRRLGRSEQVRIWRERAKGEGIECVLPFEHGKDCIDSGGESAYRLLFPEQAAQMAREFWERDRHRADGILTFSARAAAHFRETFANLPDRPEVLAFSECFPLEVGSSEGHRR